MKTLVSLILILFLFDHSLIGQNYIGRRTFGKDFAKKEIRRFTNDSSQYNAVNKNLLLKDKKSAIAFIEPFLFNKFGEETIIDERPYEIYLIDNYWWVKGTMSKKAVGGTFKIIVNAVDKEILFIIHQK